MLAASLVDFIALHNQSFYDRRDDALLDAVRQGDMDIDRLIKSLDTMYKEEIQDDESGDQLQQQLTEYSEAEQFSQRFHRYDTRALVLAFAPMTMHVLLVVSSLVHSAQLPEILHREQQYAQLIADTKHRTDAELDTLATRQQDDMDLMVEQLDVSTTPEDINRLLTEQYAELHRVRGQREAELAALKGHQRSEYHTWIGDMGYSTAGAAGGAGRRTAPTTPVVNRLVQLFAYVCSAPCTSDLCVCCRPSLPGVQSQSPLMEESFTIHLGSQLKHMHNIRILAADIARLCGPLHADEDR